MQVWKLLIRRRNTYGEIKRCKKRREEKTEQNGQGKERSKENEKIPENRLIKFPERGI
jgi:hypothetical protein